MESIRRGVDGCGLMTQVALAVLFCLPVHIPTYQTTASRSPPCMSTSFVGLSAELLPEPTIVSSETGTVRCPSGCSFVWCSLALAALREGKMCVVV